MVDRPNLPPTVTEVESETLDLRDERRTFNAGQVVGDRYQILALLGRGGMGEVWHAFDLKLRVEVALKALRSDIFKNERRRESLRQEVRSARDVVSPNVCRLYDLHELEGLELVSMEYVDGQTLLEVMRERAPFDLQEAQDLASQFLAGLDAIHAIGLVHRDIKPENIMLTRAGRVVVMDFGIAREEAEGSGTVSGTAAYMAPEQAAGQAVDARADIYSAGIVLAEMINPEGLKNRESRESVWEAVRSEPANIPDTPWASVITKAVAKDREYRFHSANDLARSLEEVTLRVAGADDLHPYPGLSAFTEENAEFFFGREAEVEQMWRKLDRPHLLAITGPSGAGKTSFLRAGIIPSAGPNWSILRCTPGTNPFASLGQALAREMAGDVKAVEILASGHQPDSLVTVIARWRNRHKNSLFIIDQFEELFTLSAKDVQQSFSNLLGRLAIDVDTFVLVSLRDDFLLRCREQQALAPVFKDLTALIPPTGGALRRAMVQPATKCGYRFEDNQLLEEMISEVEGERGALPLLAFALARLWGKRDRTTGLLTRHAYGDIGGVGGALARHAEATVDRVGPARIAQIRELFRNLVTADSTRAVREVDDLLSIFEEKDRESARAVLLELIDSRLLNSYEVREGDEEPTHSVEIIHESLLASWPRLVRWQTQDADAVQLRDQLRRATRTWDEQNRTSDTLWTGAAFREFASWREQYSGGLTDSEEAFARAMTSFANRRKRHRRLATAAALLISMVVAAVFGAMWRRSNFEMRQAKASKLVMLGQQALAKERTSAIAYAIASLDQADTLDGRFLALKALWNGPPAFALPSHGEAHSLAFSPDGEFLAAGYLDGRIVVFPRDGGTPIELEGFDRGYTYFRVDFSFDSKFLLAAPGLRSPVRVWETATWRHVRDIEVPQVVYARGYFDPDNASIFTLGFRRTTTKRSSGGEGFGDYLLHRWSFGEDEPDLLGSVVGTAMPIPNIDAIRGLVAVGHQKEIHLHRIETFGNEPPRVIARHPELFNVPQSPVFDPRFERIAMADKRGPTMLWSLDGDGHTPERILEVSQENEMVFSPDGSMLAQAVDADGSDVLLWHLDRPVGTMPTGFEYGPIWATAVAFSPDSRWLATSGDSFGLAIWPIESIRNWTIRGLPTADRQLKFSADDSRIQLKGVDGTIRSWPVLGDQNGEPTVLFQSPPGLNSVKAAHMDPAGKFWLVGDARGAWKVSNTFSDAKFIDDLPAYLLKLSPDGKRGGGVSGSTIVVIDLETGERREVEPPGTGNLMEGSWFFYSPTRVLAVRGGVLSSVDVETGATEVLLEEGVSMIFQRTGKAILLMNDDKGGIKGRGGVAVLDLGDLSIGPTLDRESMTGVGADSKAEVIATTGVEDGSIQIRTVEGGEPHHLFGGEESAIYVDLSPNARFATAFTEDSVLRLWAVPDLSKPPFHTLPHEDLMTKLKALTNLRAVPDDGETTGYRLEADPTAYRGWAKVPVW